MPNTPTHPDDANRAESAPHRDKPRPASGEPVPRSSSDEERPLAPPTPPALRDYKGGDAG